MRGSSRSTVTAGVAINNSLGRPPSPAALLFLSVLMAFVGFQTKKTIFSRTALLSFAYLLSYSTRRRDFFDVRFTSVPFIYCVNYGVVIALCHLA